jgi:hypothetical protein
MTAFFCVVSNSPFISLPTFRCFIIWLLTVSLNKRHIKMISFLSQYEAMRTIYCHVYGWIPYRTELDQHKIQLSCSCRGVFTVLLRSNGRDADHRKHMGESLTELNWTNRKYSSPVLAEACLPCCCVATAATRTTESTVCLLLHALPSNCRCLQNHRLATGLYATLWIF